jgi:uncharacterized cupredoxin-like copper-binding protein
MRRAFFVSGALLLGAMLLIACGGNNGETSDGTSKTAGTKVVAVLKEFTIEPDKTSVPAGSVTFEAQNKGTTPHELVVLQSDLAADKLTVKEGKVDESTVKVVDEIEEFDAGKTASKTMNLTAGRYILICNVVAHYVAGMYTTFTVE